MDERSTYRFFVEPLPAGGGAEVDLPAAEAHHAAHVLRLKAGAGVELFDGAGRSASARIVGVRHGQVRAVVEHVQPREERPGPLVHLAFAAPKGKRLDWLLEKATELGAASLQAVVFQRSVAGRGEASQARGDRWRGHCIAAAKQCGLNFLPAVAESAGLTEFLGACKQAVRLLGEASSQARAIAEALADWSAPREICLLVGPEGGLTEGERAEATAGGFVPVRLGRTTLRIETAAISLLAATIGACEGSHGAGKRRDSSPGSLK